MKPMNRRQFLTLSASSLGTVVLGQCSRRQPQSPSSGAIARAEGLVAVTLDARAAPVSLAGQRVQLLSYNGQIPGPRLEARPGDTVRIQFTNRLPEPTNLHYHGLHIPPTGKADNIFLSIAPGDTFTYEFTIPQNHPAGTFYYHPHRHGYVADQVFGGLGGIFVVRGGLDEIPEIQAATEVFLFLKDFAIGAGGPGPTMMGRMLGREGNLVTVNGQVNPSLAIPQGGLLRLRLVNASNARFYRLSLEEHPFYLIATDGISLSAPVEVRELLLTPGERAEVLVRGDREPGQYRLLNLPYSRGSMGMMGGGRMGPGMMGGRRRGRMGPPRGNAPFDSKTLATLSYSGQVEPLPLPQQLRAIDALPETQTLKRFTLNHGMAPGMGMVFLINGKTFSEQRVDTRASLDSVEDWEIVNTGVMDHPFHLHTNPFQIISRNGQPDPYQAWKDTVLVPAGESVRLRIRFQDFPGKTVYHCHILDHEDLGMMGNLEIN